MEVRSPTPSSFEKDFLISRFYYVLLAPKLKLGDRVPHTYIQLLALGLYPIFLPLFLMSSQPSNGRKPNPPLSHIVLHARQLLRTNTKRAANWFRKPSFSRFKLKSGFLSPSRSHSSPYSHSSLADDASRSVQSSSTTLYSIPPRAPQRSTYNSPSIRTSPVIVPIMPTVCLFLLADCPRSLIYISLVLDVISISQVMMHKFQLLS